MKLSTTYLGLNLTSPLIVGACPMATDLSQVKRLEDGGAGAIVMNSLFEEQVSGKKLLSSTLTEVYRDDGGDVLDEFPEPDEYLIRPDDYLEQIRQIKQSCDFPVIGSLNGTTLGGWLEYAGLIEQAGADALELNVYHLPTEATETAGAVEQRMLDIVQGVSRAVRIPVSVKLSPFFSALPSLAQQTEAHGARGLVLFNRFYQPDIDIELRTAVPSLRLSDESELLLRLRWLAILSPQLGIDLAESGGVHHATHAIKAIMAGAKVVQLASTLLYHGAAHMETITEDLRAWLRDHDVTSVDDIRGVVNHTRCPDPTAFERANYLRALQNWRPEGPVVV